MLSFKTEFSTIYSDRDRHDYNEKQTRDRLIDIDLKEMGWDLSHADAIEYPVTGMPKAVSPSGRVEAKLIMSSGMTMEVKFGLNA